MKRCYVIAGPNGAGKTTFATTFLPGEGDCLNFINADLIAEGLSPLDPESVALEAGKVMLRRIEAAVARGKSFAFETTFSGLNYVRRIKRWKSVGYEIIIYFLTLPTEEMALERVRLRVAAGGLSVPEDTVRRRFRRGRANLEKHYKPIADAWVVYDNSGDTPVVVEQSP